MPEPSQLVHLQDGSPIIPDYNSNLDVIEALLPVSGEKTVLTALASSDAQDIPNPDQTSLESVGDTVQQILDALRAKGIILP